MSKASNIGKVLRMLARLDFLGRRSIRGSTEEKTAGGGEGGGPARSQAGFSLLSVLIAVMIIGIMASIAVPKFSAAIATANTAKVQSDLTNIDAAITMYKLDTGTNPSKIENLSGYLTDYENIKPPQGSCYVKDKDEPITVSASAYSIAVKGSEYRAVCDGRTAGEFGKKAATAAAGGNT